MRTLLKRILLLLGVIISSPLIILSYLESIIFGKDTEKIYTSCKELLASIPTLFGNYIRLGFYWAVCTKVAPDVTLLWGSMIAHRDTILNAGVVVGVHSIIGYAEVGRDVMFGARCSVISGKYQHGRPEDRAENIELKEEYTKINIGANSWIGEGALILADIGANCTVAAGSIVFKDVPDSTTVMGNPARKVSMG